MYPQTHVYFAQRVCGTLTLALALGSIFPDIVAGLTASRIESHGRGIELYEALAGDPELRDFARGVITHGVTPRGLDYYGDEKFLHYERGYCFEKARALVAETVAACNLPPSLGWWKSHNIVEMGIELQIGQEEQYGRVLAAALSHRELLAKVSDRVAAFYGLDPRLLFQRIYNFLHYIEVTRPTAEKLAAKYDVQMFSRHRIRIDVEKTARLISWAREAVMPDLEDFFAYVEKQVRQDLSVGKIKI